MFSFASLANTKNLKRITSRRSSALVRPIGWMIGMALASFASNADEIEDCQKLYLKGDYEECVRMATSALKDRFTKEDWSILLTRSQLELGHYGEALNVISNAMTRHTRSLPVHLLARDVYLQNGQSERAKEILEEINELASARRYSVPDTATFVALGRAALLFGADARLVLENFFNQAKKSDPEFRETYLAIGELALSKGDYDLAAKNFQEGLKKFPSDPDMLYGASQAYSTGDRAKMVENLEKALEQNPKHIPSLLMVADHQIDAEEYGEAEKTLAKVLAVNPANPEAWAYRGVLANLKNDAEGEAAARTKALKLWKTNPQVVHLIGQKLSQKYRFVEGSTYQREALKWDPDYLPAKIQLAQDLLRLGQDEEGWKLAEEVNQTDGYDTTAYNLVTLRDTLSKFQVRTNQDFVIWMHPKEAPIYGDDVIELLTRAKSALSQKYAFDPPKPTIIEIFPEQKDFAVRTFMMPGGEGYLGVCFGNVITANSPAAQTANPSNWKAMLWHEFCHVITLGLTKNKMPRWLSEGISVYEERRANRAWGQAMSPRYREMILKGELTPVGELSAAFLTPKSGFHLQFAYYESALVVEFLVDRFGFDALKNILIDLGAGKSINESIEARTAPLSKIEKEFDAFARERAEQLGPGLEWKRPEAPGSFPFAKAKKPITGASDDLWAPLPAPHRANDDKWMDQYPKNYWVLHEKAKKLIAAKKYEEAKVPLKTLIENFPDQIGSESSYLLLASVHRALNETNLERQALAKLAILDAEAIDAFLRIMELASAAGDWSDVATNAERYLAVNPLVPAPHRYFARAQEALRHPDKAIRAYKTLLELDPPDPADVHFRLAKLLYAAGDHSAKRHVLQALEEAPRFLEAYRLLVTIIEKDQASANRTTETPAENPPKPKE